MAMPHSQQYFNIWTVWDFQHAGILYLGLQYNAKLKQTKKKVFNNPHHLYLKLVT